MSIGSYFVSDEAEKAANWDSLEEFRKAKQHRDLLADAMLRLGQTLGDFANTLQHPRGCSFDARHNEIVVGKEQRPIARVEPMHLDWAIVSRLITDYVVTVNRIAELEPRFRDLNKG